MGIFWAIYGRLEMVILHYLTIQHMNMTHPVLTK